MSSEKVQSIEEIAYNYATFLYNLYTDELDNDKINIGQNNAAPNVIN